eukprot:CAMPEP_0197044992 /NCGR_PEP_ID=MMETSP1384-20130603/20939_1 /TAXON_ID=29189 /ORGANISM="Ammonia sp." /LENGTH=274 /DNA_ID=CAMNT_0042476535 /DNA_START=9 /DNA_END=833 /DNA_ORIENTATION=-
MAATDAKEQAMAEKRKGNEAFVQNKFVEAINHYTNALDLVSDVRDFDGAQRSILYANKAECYIRLKKYKEALPCCDSALKYDSANIKARFRRAKANEKLLKYKESLRDLQYVIKKDSKNTKALDLMRIVQRKLGIGTSSNANNKTLSYDPETDVTEKDQNDICEYNVLNHVKIELDDELTALNEKIRGVDDGLEAIEMLLDEDACRIELGNSFVYISNEDTEQSLKAQSKELKARRNELKQKLNETIDKMGKLRGKLKAKFGDHIGLPEIKGTK